MTTYTRDTPETDIWYLERDEANRWQPHPYLETPSSEQEAKLSPDGRYLAYISDESGQQEVYVSPFPDGGRRVKVSRGGGLQPRWSRDGGELYYARPEPNGTGSLVAASVSTESGFAVASEERLFGRAVVAGFPTPEYDVSADGRFLFQGSLGEAPEPSIRIVENWYEEFRDPD